MRALPIAVLVLTCLAVAVVADEPKAAAKSPKGDVKRGESLFDIHCADCHDAFSKDEVVGPGLQGISKGKIPDGRKATYELLLDIINTGPAEMTSFEERLTEQEKADIVTYVLTL
jgi:mono/diheme cytochrome c family protein